jgi:dienelactone hydrolase
VAEVLLFHHAQGLTPGVLAFADRLREGGHVVYTPDLYQGRTFTDLTEGVGYARGVGFDTIIERGQRAAEGLPNELVYAGFSLGVLSAQSLAQTRSGARGALFYYACVPVTEFGSGWPEGVPVQIHAMEDDPFFVDEGDIEAARALVAEAADGVLFLYPGKGHLFADSSLPDYDEAASELLIERTLSFLSEVA